MLVSMNDTRKASMLKRFLLLPGYLIRFWMNLLFVFGGLKNMGDAQRFLGANTDFGLVANAVAGWVGIFAVASLFLIDYGDRAVGAIQPAPPNAATAPTAESETPQPPVQSLPEQLSTEAIPAAAKPNAAEPPATGTQAAGPAADPAPVPMVAGESATPPQAQVEIGSK